MKPAVILGRLYAALRPFMNFFQSSFKLARKVCDAAKVSRTYHPSAAPCQRLLADAPASEEIGQRITGDLRHATLDPVQLLQRIRGLQQAPVALADRPAGDEGSAPTSATLETFFSGLRTAWHGGECPTVKEGPRAGAGVPIARDGDGTAVRMV